VIHGKAEPYRNALWQSDNGARNIVDVIFCL